MSSYHAFCTAILMLIAAIAIPITANAETCYVEGSGGVPLAVTIAGPEDGPEILFLHGIGMGAESFAPQMQSELAQRYRMVAFDLRGHGMSGKPWDVGAFTDTAIWAEDVRAIIAATGLHKPIIVAWSYGGLVAADYVRWAGTRRLSGIVLTGSLAGLVKIEPTSGEIDPAISEQWSRSQSLRQSLKMSEQREAIAIVTPMLVAKDAAPGWLENAETLGLMVPPYAQGPLRQHSMDNIDLLPKITNLPLMILRGEYDFATPISAANSIKQAKPDTVIETIVGAGHSAFAEQPGIFNRALSAFVDRYWKAPLSNDDEIQKSCGAD